MDCTLHASSWGAPGAQGQSPRPVVPRASAGRHGIAMTLRPLRSQALSRSLPAGALWSAVGDERGRGEPPTPTDLRSDFEELLGRSLGGGPRTPPKPTGGETSATEAGSAQGLRQSPVDGEVQSKGQGYLVLRGTVAGLTADFYTKSAKFSRDHEGYVASEEGLVAQGWGVGKSLAEAAPLSALRVEDATLSARPTRNVRLALALEVPPELRFQNQLGFSVDEE